MVKFFIHLMMKLGGYVHCTKILPEFEFLGHKID